MRSRFQIKDAANGGCPTSVALVVHFEHFFGLLRHPRKLPTVAAYVMTSCVTIRWCSVSTATWTLTPTIPDPASAGGHRTGIRISERYLLIRRLAHLRIKHFQCGSSPASAERSFP